MSVARETDRRVRVKEQSKQERETEEWVGREVDGAGEFGAHEFLKTRVRVYACATSRSNPRTVENNAGLVCSNRW